jgi:hypothetical protein
MAGLTAGPRPDITPPQIVAMVAAGIPILAQLLHAFGIYDLTVEAQVALNNAVTWASVLAGSLIGGDALLRLGRNLRMGNVESALAAGGEGDRLEIVKKITDSAATVVPTEGRSDTTTGFEKTP